MMDLDFVRRDVTRSLPLSPRPLALVIVAAGALGASLATSAVAAPLSGAPAPWVLEPWTRADSLPQPGILANQSLEAQGAQIMDLRRRTGLTWEKLAELFGVDRRSVHFWASDRPMNAPNREKLGRALGFVRRIAADAEQVRQWLLSPGEGGVLPFDQLRDGLYDAIVVPPGFGSSLRGHAGVTAAPKVSPEALRARAPRPPDELVEAGQETIHREVGKARRARSVKVRP
jgi:hypothetical protein